MHVARFLLLMSALILALAHVTAAASDDRATQRRAFADAVAAFARGDDDQALRAFQGLRESYPALSDYHLHFIAGIHLRRQQTVEAKKALSALLANTPRSVHGAAAALDLGRLAAAEKDFRRAKSFFERAVYLGDETSGDAARLELAKIAFRTADTNTAYTAFAEVRRSARGTEVGRVAKEYVATLRTQNPQLVPSGRDALAEADTLLVEGDFNGALYFAEAAAAAVPEIRPQALRRKADAQFGMEDSEKAFATLWEIVDTYPRHPDAPVALHRLASRLWNRDRDEAAMRAFTRYVEIFPRGDKLVDARYAIARIHESAGRITAAKQHYEQLISAYPRHGLAAESRWRLAWIEYRADEWWEAAEAFAELAERTTGGERDAAMYWRARCHQRLGNSDRARQFYATIAEKRSYYGMWATQRLRQLAGEGLQRLDVRQLATSSTVIAPVRPGTPPRGVDAFHWGRFVELDAARLPRLAHAEIAAVEEAAGANTPVRRFLFDAYRTIERYDDALRLLARLGSTAGLDSAERRRTLYPLAFWSAVRDEGHRRQVDPLLVLGLMRQESLFKPDARSPANAVGVLQLIPSTARRMAAAPDLVGADPNDLTDPGNNIRLGVYYLGGLLDMYGGDPFKALAAYNGGEAAVEKWQQRWPGAEPDEFVESITFRETRDYVKKVLGNYMEYRELYRR